MRKVAISKGMDQFPELAKQAEAEVTGQTDIEAYIRKKDQEAAARSSLKTEESKQ